MFQGSGTRVIPFSVPGGLPHITKLCEGLDYSWLHGLTPAQLQEVLQSTPRKAAGPFYKVFGAIIEYKVIPVDT